MLRRKVLVEEKREAYKRPMTEKAERKGTREEGEGEGCKCEEGAWQD